MLVACTLLLLCNFALEEAPFALRLVALVCRSAGTGMLLVAWLLRYAEADDADVAGVVLAAIFLALGLFLVEKGLSPWIESVLNLTLPVISAGACVLANVKGAPAPASSASSVGGACPPWFWRGMCLYGVGCGFVCSVSMAVSGPAWVPNIYSSLVSPSVGIVLLACSLYVVAVRKCSYPSHIVIVVPILVPVLLLIPYFNLGVADVSKIATGTSLLCFQSLMAALLPYYRRRYGIEPFGLAFKAALLEEGGACATVIVCAPAAAWLCGAGFDQHAGFLLTMVACAVSVSVIYALMQFILAKRSVDEREALAHQHGSASDEICAKVSLEFSLTPREQEVFRLLAAGRSQRYIQETLVISEGTTRTHIKHVYQKLGVHRKQELIDLVDARRDS